MMFAALAERSFAALERNDHSGVIACFTEDTFYSHPPYKEGGGRIEVRGHDGLAAFLGERGVAPTVTRSESSRAKAPARVHRRCVPARHTRADPVVRVEGGRRRRRAIPLVHRVREQAASRSSLTAGDADGRRRRSCVSTTTAALCPAPITWQVPTRAPATWRVRLRPRSCCTSSWIWPEPARTPSGSPLESRPPDGLTGTGRRPRWRPRGAALPRRRACTAASSR